MRKSALATGAAIPAALLAIGLALAGCSSPSAGGAMGGSAPAPMASSSSSSSSSSMEKTGDFMGLNDKMVKGTATVTGSMLTLSGFSSDEGPDLHVYLTSGTDEAAVSAGMEIDAVAFDKASQTFTLKDVDLSKYTDVVIHCDKAKAVFGAAALS